jgi:hypothetical protein
MEKKSTTEILLIAALIGGAVYFLFFTETGRIWLERLQNTAADQLDQWLSDLETQLRELELAEISEASRLALENN